MKGLAVDGLDIKNDERGFALVVSMLILLVMTLLGLVLMSSVVLNRSLTGNDQRMRQSLNIAEAGVSEAMSRIGHLDTQMLPTDPNGVCQVFNTVAGNVPALGADSVGLATGQPVGSYLNYTSATRGPDVLTIGWKKDPTGTLVMRYDGAATPQINAATGYPIYTITSTGRIGTTRRTVVTEVIQRPFNVAAKAALSANIPINSLGNAVICGYNHSIDTPYDDGIKGRGSGPGGPKDCIDNELGHDDLPGMYCTQPVNPGGAFLGSGSPSDWVENQVGFYAGPWEALGMSQAEFFSFIGAPVTNPPNWKGVYYIDNNAVTQDLSADLKLTSVDGEGFIYVDGNLHISSNFHYTGLIYVEGDFDINGNAWVLGGIIVKGQTNIKANGGMTILYSKDAINQSLSKYGGQFVTLNWREQ
jgi:Tfp pilus assembly protein PilX